MTDPQPRREGVDGTGAADVDGVGAVDAGGVGTGVSVVGAGLVYRHHPARPQTITTTTHNHPPPQVTSPRRVLLKLFAHSVAMFTLPFMAYFYSKSYVEREYGLVPPKSYIYGAIAAVIIIQGVIFSYIYQAFQEEQLAKRVTATAAAKQD